MGEPENGLLQNEFDRDEDVLVGSALMKVVGIKYYTGVLHKGEFAYLVREPRNPYDRNAIAVKNHVGNQVGHIARDFAASLAPILDDCRSSAPTVEAVVLQPAVASVSIRVSFYAPAACVQDAVRSLRRYGIVLTQEAGKRGGGEAQGSGGTVVSKTDGSAVQLSSQKALNELFDRIDADKPKREDLDACRKALRGKMNAILLPHQEEGVAWMLNKETSKQRLPFWKEVMEKGKRVFYSEITNSSYSEDPGSPCGGILADDMGLGKTLQVLALVVANPAGGGRDEGAGGGGARGRGAGAGAGAGSVIDLTSDDTPFLEGTGGSQKKVKMEDSHACVPAARGTTLIVCPTSVMANWQDQATLHVLESYGLQVLIHHGKSKEVNV
jgi:SWI/SNF-related matrix-associated actin-dependent regulator of chromatin subfamily A3